MLYITQNNFFLLTNSHNFSKIRNFKKHKIFQKIRRIEKNKKRTFQIEKIDDFLKVILNPKIKASSHEKKDITITIKEPLSKYILSTPSSLPNVIAEEKDNF